MKRVFFVIIVIAVLAFTGVSCNRQKKEAEIREKFKVEKVESFRANGLTSYDLGLLVTNSTRHEFTLESGFIDVFYAGSKLGTIVADDAVTVPKRATTSIQLPLTLNIGNPLAIYGAYGKIQQGEIDKITLSLTAQIKVAGIKQTVERKNIPLSTVLAMFGVDASDLKNALKF